MIPLSETAVLGPHECASQKWIRTWNQSPQGNDFRLRCQNIVLIQSPCGEREFRQIVGHVEYCVRRYTSQSRGLSVTNMTPARASPVQAGRKALVLGGKAVKHGRHREVCVHPPLVAV